MQHSADMPHATPIDPLRRRQGRRTLLLILLVAAAPIVAAYVAFFFWQPQARNNYGELLAPQPLDWGTLRHADGSAFDAARVRGRWVMAYVGPGACDASCRQSLYYTRQVRIAQAKEMDRVERLWLLTDGAMPQAGDVQDVPTAARSSDPALAAHAGRVVLIDPVGNLMLRFPADPDPKGMIRDLQRLLKYSRAG